MINNTKYAQKLLAAQDKRRGLTAEEKTLETALQQGALLSYMGETTIGALDAHKAQLASEAVLFWDYLTFAVVVTADSFGVRPGTWQTETPEEIAERLIPGSATDEQAENIRAVVAAVSEAMVERQGQATPEFLETPDAELLHGMTGFIATLAASRAKSKKTASALIIRGIRNITDQYHKAPAQ